MAAAPQAKVRALVLCRHAAVRHQLMALLGRSPLLVVTASDFTPDAIAENSPDVVLIDLSQVDQETRRQVLVDAAHRGAGVVALASIPSQVEEDDVRAVGGIYRLKQVGAEGLAAAVLAAARSDHRKP